MVPVDARARALMQRRSVAAAQAPKLAEILRGTLLRRYVRCGKAGCQCQTGPGHGPFRYLTVALGARQSRQITIAPEDYATAKRYVANYRRLWRLLEKISTINRELLQQRRLPPDSPPKRRTSKATEVRRRRSRSR